MGVKKKAPPDPLTALTAWTAQPEDDPEVIKRMQEIDRRVQGLLGEALEVYRNASTLLPLPPVETLTTRGRLVLPERKKKDGA